jgi:glyoxylase-like metal-dependent hydrolase (beta-lactamase superfamily II)
MVEILPGVHQVDGLDPSPDFSTHVYLLKDKGATWTLLDAGLPGSDGPILAYLQKLHVEPTAIKRILLTHLHQDHTGGLKRMIELTHARTFSHWIEAGFIAHRPVYEGPGMPPKDAIVIDEVLKDGDPVDAAGGLTAYHTPGHTPGHMSYYSAERRILFCGDLFMAGGGRDMVLTVPEYTQHMGTAKISARRVGQLSVESIMTYHGGPFPHDGGKRLRTLLEKL